MNNAKEFGGGAEEDSKDIKEMLYIGQNQINETLLEIRP